MMKRTAEKLKKSGGTGKDSVVGFETLKGNYRDMHDGNSSFETKVSECAPRK